MIMRIWPAFLLLSGCASLNDVVGGIGNAPDWFRERRVEIRGEGYPLLREVPVVNDTNAGFQRMEETSVTAEIARLYLEDHPRAELSIQTPEDILAPFEPMRAELPDIEPSPDEIISAEELESLLSQLVPPPPR
ncbi:MAG: hypothetical protein AAF292_14335 [Pseudomonadota bacterium]